MERRHIHPQGPEFSRIVAGVWRWHTIPEDAVGALVHAALDNGITTFDHADIYGDHGNEELFGRVLRAHPGLRSRMEIVTKCGIKFPSQRRPGIRVKHYDTSKEHIVGSVENSLRQLNTDYIDLLLIHRPDPMMNPIEVAEAFAELRIAGKALHFGVSNFTISLLDMLQSYVDEPLVTNQIELSLANISPLFDGTVDGLMKNRISPMAWSPLGGGRLMDSTSESVFELCHRHRASKSQVALAWLLAHPAGVFPVVGTTQVSRLEEISRSVDISLDRQDWFEMLKASTEKDVP